jgi:hypothetical protein
MKHGWTRSTVESSFVSMAIDTINRQELMSQACGFPPSRWVARALSLLILELMKAIMHKGQEV